MLEPTMLCERILRDLRSRSAAGEHLSMLDSQLIILVSYFLQTNPTPETFVAKLEEYGDGSRGDLLAQAARLLLERYRSPHLP